MRGLLFAFFVLVATFAQGATRNILVIGFWPPTNEMIRSLSPKPEHNPQGWQGHNWKNLGYDVYAYFPEFRNINKDAVGEGDFRVDFASTYNDFMEATQNLQPVAILGFGHGAGEWRIETQVPSFFTAWFKSGQIPSVVGELVRHPIPESLKQDVWRYSSLPVYKIAENVNNARIRVNAHVETEGNPGNFLCGFLSYLIGWYHDEHASPEDPAQNKAGGFIHVTADLDKARRALDVTLRTTIESLQ